MNVHRGAFESLQDYLKGKALETTEIAPASLCRGALEALCDGFVEVDPKGRVLSCSEGLLRLTGGDSSPAAIDRLFPPGARPLDLYAAGNARESRACVLSARQGEVRANVFYTRGPAGVLASVQLEAPAEQAGSIGQRVQEQPQPGWMAAVLDAADSAIVVIDREGRFERFNRAALLLTGYTPDEVLGRLLWEMVLFDEDIEPVRAEFSKLVGGEAGVSRYENRWRMKDGSSRIFSWSNAVTKDKDGNVEYVVATALDMPASRLTESALASLSGEFIDAQSAGRRSVSRYLHDTVSQYLVVLALTLSKLQRAPDKEDPFEIAPTLDLIDRCCRDLRVVSYALAPPIFDDSEPVAAFGWYIDHLRADAGLDVQFHAEAAIGPISQDARKLLLAAMQEWAERAIRSRTAGKTRIRLATLASGVLLELSSDQPDNDAVTAVAASRVIRERVRALGGTLEIAPRRPGVSVKILISAV